MSVGIMLNSDVHLFSHVPLLSLWGVLPNGHIKPRCLLQAMSLSPQNMLSRFKRNLTAQITGGKKQSDEGAALFGVRVNLPCYATY